MITPAPKLVRPADLVYSVVKQRIMLNQLKPEAVLTELGLAHEIGCSQGTIREALLRLQEEGLVARTGRRGTCVTRLNAEEARELLNLRKQVEGRGALKAVRALDDATLASLDELRREMAEAARAGDEYGLIEADSAFHLAVFRLAELPALEPILVRCIMHGHRSKLWAPGHRRPLVDTARRHDPLYELLAARDGEGLAAALGEHIDTIVLEDEERERAA